MPNALESTARYSVLLILALLTSCASAAYNVEYLAELEPPVQYNHPYDGPVDEHVMSTAEVRSQCVSMGTSPFIAACSLVSDDGTCHIILPNDGQAPTSTYRRHETAHCNGWSADHPRGQQQTEVVDQ
jgi:hypothetical protein